MKILKNILAVFLISSLLLNTVYGAGGDWGLSYPEPGKTPRGNESVQRLLEMDAYFVGNTEENNIYLTFDAGYENGYTEKILDTLLKYEIPAAFFLVGTYIRDNPELVRRMVKEGHIVANHTMSHPDMSEISDINSFEQQLYKTEELYKAETGLEMPKYYRPPRGKYSIDNMQMAKKLGYKTIFWSLAYVDWDVNKQPSKDAAFSKLLPRIHPGAVLLLHSTSKTNAEILGELIEKYQELGYQFKSVDHLVNN